jgi:hypothetical protein
MDDQLLNQNTSSDGDEVVLENLPPELQQRFKDLQARMAEGEAKANAEKRQTRAVIDESLAKARQLITKIDVACDDLDKADTEAESELDKLALTQIQEEADEDKEDENEAE